MVQNNILWFYLAHEMIISVEGSNTMAAKTYEQKMKAYKATCKNMAGLEVLNMKFQIASENADAAGLLAARAARWVFTAYPELRD